MAEYYNNLDIVPGLEALEKMRDFYEEKGIDILKDTVSIPGVSLQYLLRGAIERGAELWEPNKEEYQMLKGAVVRGPSLVFTRMHEAGKTRIRSYQIKNPKVCQKILGFDANALYLLTMAKDMPCGKGVITRPPAWKNSSEKSRMRSGLVTQRLTSKSQPGCTKNTKKCHRS